MPFQRKTLFITVECDCGHSFVVPEEWCLRHPSGEAPCEGLHKDGKLYQKCTRTYDSRILLMFMKRQSMVTFGEYEASKGAPQEKLF